MSNRQFFQVELDDYAAPGFYSGSKHYFGTMEQIHEWISAIESDDFFAPKFKRLCATYHTYCSGDTEVTHPVAYREVLFLKPAVLRHKEESHLSYHEWEHINIWGFPHYMKCDYADVTHLWLKCDQKNYRHIIARFKNLQYQNSIGEWCPLRMYWGFPKIIVEEGGITRNLLAVREKHSKRELRPKTIGRTFKHKKILISVSFAMTSLVTVNEKKFDGYPEERGIAMTHRIKTVIVLPGFKLRVQFSEGVTKLYDLKPLFERIPAFQYLRDNPAEFECVFVDVGGRGIVWNDDIDLSCDELWENGVVVETSITGGIR